MSYWIAGAATVGALADRKKPLRGALMGAGVGASGGALMGGGMGGLMGSGAATGGASTAAAGATAPTAGAAAPSTGLLSSMNAGLQQYQPMINAASTGLQMSGALDQQPQQQMQAPEVQQSQGGAQTLAQLASTGGSQQMQGDMQERMRRRQMLRGGA